ncbi:hypothetical protein J2W20_002968 [Sinomonas atrocyanea]|nr:hypothetical protein [Sinomonas atrocyanea]MDQ0261054.1 hypothetical protein [Sinomonas atrocyanea]
MPEPDGPNDGRELARLDPQVHRVEGADLAVAELEHEVRDLEGGHGRG